MISTLYKVIPCHASVHKKLIVDYGVNERVAGDNVCIIAKTNKSVDVGINPRSTEPTISGFFHFTIVIKK